MNKKTLESFTLKINEMEATTRASIESLHQQAKALEEGSKNMDSFDQSSNNSEMNRLRNLESQANRQLVSIVAAKDRIAKNKFGICLTCEEDIPAKRLLSNPLSIRCIDCQQDLEDSQRIHKTKNSGGIINGGDSTTPTPEED